MEVITEIDEMPSAFSDVEQNKATPGWDMDIGSQVAFWSGETLVNCFCGAPLDTYCTCLPTSQDFALEGDHSHQVPMRQDHAESTNSEYVFSAIEPQVREDLRPAMPTRKERRRQQNRAAQVRHRDKRNRFLHETLRNFEALNEELKQTKAQRDYFRLMYEDLETQMTEMRSQSSSRVQSSSPRQN
ncbi:hypothetical protein PV04_02643 [Phialophora macrospora]|uniref:BZIP domain-containing protein n=1 Tax=Phialophora macrospora TaxID=1851006 RepID=A0A0D2GDZ2_9EURO|nr:hypothetical protein PV04_02643 [Phialophora macrospora]